ncbi:hypothetical protein ACHQM5_003462 [Ranunculus cassubicifolius]
MSSSNLWSCFGISKQVPPKEKLKESHGVRCDDLMKKPKSQAPIPVSHFPVGPSVFRL